MRASTIAMARAACLAASAVSAVLLAAAFPIPTIAALAACVPALACIAVVDARSRKIPISVVRPLYVASALFSISFETPDILAAIPEWAFSTVLVVAPMVAPAAAAWAVATCLLGKPSPVGMGDVRLLLAICLMLRTDALLALAAGCVMGLAWCAAMRCRTFPFGPCLALPATAIAFAKVAVAAQWI